MGTTRTLQVATQLPKAEPSLLSQMNLHFEYNKRISKVRANLTTGKNT